MGMGKTNLEMGCIMHMIVPEGVWARLASNYRQRRWLAFYLSGLWMVPEEGRPMPCRLADFPFTQRSDLIKTGHVCGAEDWIFGGWENGQGISLGIFAGRIGYGGEPDGQ